jgi:cytochrome c peroxidase
MKKIRLLLLGGVITLLVATYALAIARPLVVRAANDQVRINELMAGSNGDSRIQFIEIAVQSNTQKDWGPQAGETVGRAMLTFHDAAGNQTGRYVFPSDPGGAGLNVLIATQEFANLLNAPTPDFILPKEVMAVDGKVCFRNNPDNANADPINLCLSYGAFTGDSELAGAPAPLLPIMDVNSLQRFQNFTFGSTSNLNADFQISTTPNPTNTAGATFSIAVKPRVEQGRILFLFETFNGNGRTCGTCHRPQDGFGIQPDDIALLPDTDPLFIANFNLNTLVLTDDANPSDLRGVITATNGVTATVLGGRAALTYWIYGGQGMTGSVTDSKGNSGVIQSFSLGDLNGLENPTLLESRALFAENPDGFGVEPNFRKSPHLLNLALTSPFGFSGVITDLQEQAIGAITQHNPKTLARVSGPDFRTPTQAETQAIEDFQRGIFMPTDQDFTLSRFVTTEAQKRGQKLFFGQFSQAEGFNCQSCHESEVLSGILNFNTNVMQLPINGPGGDDLPREPISGPLRQFSTLSLFGIKRTGPYFHENGAATLRDSVAFYCGPEFQNGPNGFLVNPIVCEDPQNFDDVAAFMAALVDKPFEANPPGLTFPNQQIILGQTPPQTIVVTNTGATSLTITGLVMNAGSPASFVVTSPPDATPFFPGETRTISAAFDPFATGLVTTSLEITVTSVVSAEDWAWGFVITGTGISSPPTISDIVNQTINANSSTGALAFTVGDLDTSPFSLTVSGASSNTVLVPNANIVFGGSGTSRTVTVTPASSQSGTATITVTVSDGGAPVSDAFLLTVNAFPTISNITNQTTDEDTALGPLDFTIGDAETAPASLTLTGSSSNPTLVPNANIVFGGSGADRTLTITPAANLSGSATITVTVSDGLASTTDTFLLNVLSVNDLPTITPLSNQTIDEDTSTAALAFTVGDVETPVANLQLSGSSNNPTLVPNANIVFGGSGANRTVTVVPALNQSGVAIITVSVSDGTDSADSTFVLTVNAVNDAPTISNITAQSMNEDTTSAPIPFTIGDVETPAANLVVTASSSNTTLVPNGNLVLGGAGEDRSVTITPAADQWGVTTITINVSDGTATNTDSFVLTVNNVNDPVSLGDIPDQTTTEDVPLSSVPLPVVDVDHDGTAVVSAVSDNPTLIPNANVVFGEVGGNWFMSLNPRAGEFGVAHITVTVSDGLSSDSDTFTLTVIEDPIKELFLPLVTRGPGLGASMVQPSYLAGRAFEAR